MSTCQTNIVSRVKVSVMCFSCSNVNASGGSTICRSLELSGDSLSMVLVVTIEVTREFMEDPFEEHVKSSLPRKFEYEWVHEEVRLTTSKF